MRVTKRELKPDGRGELSVVPETLDDLWHLKHILEAGDLVYATTQRRVERATDKLRPEKGEKKTVRLGIRVESVEFHKFANRLRVRGVIEAGLETAVGSYHTLNIEPGVELSIIKAWKKHQLKRVEDAERAAARPKVIILTIEEGDAVAGIVRQYGVDEVFYVRAGSGKGASDSAGERRTFFGEALSMLKNALRQFPVDAVIVAGPGFTKDDFLAFVREREPELAAKMKIESVSSIGLSGFREVLKRGVVEEICREERIAKEVQLIEKLMEEVSKDGLAAYGDTAVRSALSYGAVEKLLVCDERLRDAGRESVETLLKEAERRGGEVVIFSTEFEPGEMLKALGGIAALLRFKID
ncbi:MAG: Stalled ribosome rescue protein Dom34 [Candidatus Alkanophagales archaeon MCA70_species_2]|nr:Stalled ribosome rescue protein Dom34 [Candidatus Alkanophaga liquidiphilum]RLG38527.1 MAG: mRNA surveillance protein pelota [Candidatus Alkanophagales archaeon]